MPDYLLTATQAEEHYEEEGRTAQLAIVPGSDENGNKILLWYATFER